MNTMDVIANTSTLYMVSQMLKAAETESIVDFDAFPKELKSFARSLSFDTYLALLGLPTNSDGSFCDSGREWANRALRFLDSLTDRQKELYCRINLAKH